jgi:Lrp/AsnC family leucine-responsive transcriptional regulator
MDHNLDAIDIKLLSILQENSRITNAELSSRLGLSPSACYRRAQLLESQGVIVGYYVSLSPTRVALKLQAFIRVHLVKSNHQVLNEFIEGVASWPEVISCYAITGDCDFLLHVITRDLESYTHFMMHRLLVSPSVATANSSIVLDVVKRELTLPLEQVMPKD